MGNYTTAEALVTRFGRDDIRRLSDRNGINDVDEDVVNAAINNAEQIVNGKLDGLAALPLATVPPIVASLTEELAFCFLYENKTEIPEAITMKRKNVMQMLDDFRAGKAGLGLAAGGAAEAPETGRVSGGKAGDGNPLSMNATKGW